MAENCGNAMNEPIIDVQAASVTYKIRHGASSSLKETFISTIKREKLDVEVKALKSVTFQVFPGETLAVIGRNGAGKSTLMKILARVLPPTTGRVVVRGSVAPMIELGAGFNPELTGRENIVLYGTLLGRKPAEMMERATSIGEWAEVAESLDLPVRTYSSGMLAKLAFAVATDIKSEVVLIDEILSVGDSTFQAKSKKRMLDFFQSDSAVVLVSHDVTAIRELATKALWIDQGNVMQYGEVDQVLDAYLSR